MQPFIPSPRKAYPREQPDPKRQAAYKRAEALSYTEQGALLDSMCDAAIRYGWTEERFIFRLHELTGMQPSRTDLVVAGEAAVLEAALS